MVEGIKVGGVWFSLYFLIMGILQSLSVQMRLIPHALKKSSCWIVGVKSIPLLGLIIL